MSGSPASYYDDPEYVAWLLSDSSRFLPEGIRAGLTTGMAELGVWTWSEHELSPVNQYGYERGEFDGCLQLALMRIDSLQAFRPSADAFADAADRMRFSAKLLDLPRVVMNSHCDGWRQASWFRTSLNPNHLGAGTTTTKLKAQGHGASHLQRVEAEWELDLSRESHVVALHHEGLRRYRDGRSAQDRLISERASISLDSAYVMTELRQSARGMGSNSTPELHACSRWRKPK